MWLAGRVYLDMRRLEAVGDDQVPLAAVLALNSSEAQSGLSGRVVACGTRLSSS